MADDDTNRPHLRLAVENVQKAVDRSWSPREIEWPLRELAANIIRASRGAGDPYSVIIRCLAVVQVAHSHHEKCGDWPDPIEFKEALDFHDVHLRDYRAFQILLDAIVAGGRSQAMTLEEEVHNSDFFKFFSLEQSCAPETTDKRRIWQCFRPSGPNFRPMVELAVLTDKTGRIVRTRLGVDRYFIDHPTNGAFARDVTKSYLSWALPPPLLGEAQTLIANIADLRGAPVLMRAPGPPPSPPDPTGGYDVYLGARDCAELSLPPAQLILTNVDGSFPTNRIYAVALRGSVAGLETLAQRRPGLWLAIEVTVKPRQFRSNDPR